MNLKKLPKFALMSLIGLSCFTMSACNKDDRVEVIFWHTMGQANQEKLNAMIEAFEAENPNIHVTHAQQGGYTDIEAKLLKAIPAKTTPTMAFCYPDHVANYIDAKAAVKLNSYVDAMSAEELQDYKDAGFWDEGASYDSEGSIYSVPFSKSTEVLFVNASWLKSNGFTDDGTITGNPLIPTKWENNEDPNDLTAMFNLCRAIKKKHPTITPFGYDSDDNMYITLSAQYGIPYTSIDAEGNGSIDFDNQQAKDLVTRLKGYYDEGLFVTKGVLPNNSYTSTKFTKEELIFSVGSTGGTSYNIPAIDSDGNYAFDVQVAPIPQYDANNPKVISQGPSITFFQNSKISQEQMDASWKFYRFITNSNNSAAYAIFTGYEPVCESAYTSSAYVAHLAKLGTEKEDLFTKVANLTVKDTIKNAYFFSPVFVGSSTARQECGGIITQVLLDNKTVDKAFKDAKTNTIFAME